MMELDDDWTKYVLFSEALPPQLNSTEMTQTESYYIAKQPSFIVLQTQHTPKPFAHDPEAVPSLESHSELKKLIQNRTSKSKPCFTLCNMYHSWYFHSHISHSAIIQYIYGSSISKGQLKSCLTYRKCHHTEDRYN